MEDFLCADIAAIDPEINEMIASESICPRAVKQAMATGLGHLYAEGYPSTRMCAASLPRLGEFSEFLSFYRRYGSRRYYKGVEYADFVEALARRRAAELFATERAAADAIHVNVQSLSGAAANNAVYEAFLRPGDSVMGMDLTHGGHLTHGHEVNRSGKHYAITHYRVGADGRLDYEAMKKLAAQVRPKLIIAGFSAYPWDIDWRRMREVADAAGPEPAVLLADIAHTAGLISAGLVNSPVGYADAISMTTHKTLCGPRGAIILSTDKAFADRIDTAVFPGEQGGPHVHQIAAKAVAFQIALTPAFKAMMKGVAENAAALAEALAAEGLPLAYGGTNTHMVLLDLRKVKTRSGDTLSGEIASRMLDLCGITCNKNTIWGDLSAFDPGAVRFGTTWLTQRGFGPDAMRRIAKIVGKVLGACSSFRYIGAFGDIVRARTAPSALLEARGEVEKLIEDVTKKRPGGRGYPHDVVREQDAGGENRAIEVYGERAHLMLEHLLSADVLAMEVGERKSAYVFRGAGDILAKTVVERLADDTFGRRHFLVQPYEGSSRELLEWFRAVSDGYALVDEEDPHLKPYGPACVVFRDVQRSLSQPDSKLEIDICKPYFVGQKAILKKVESFPDIVGSGIIKGGKSKKEFSFEWEPPEGAAARETCLYGEHLKLADRRRIAAFAGWKLPLWFSSIAEEHRAVRTAAGLFDVSHMGVLEFAGPGAESFLDMTTTAYTPALVPGQAKYSYLLAPDGRVIDDIMLYRLAAERFIIVVNAANAEEDEAWWRAAATGEIVLDLENKEMCFKGKLAIRNLKDPESGDERKVDVALQGPASTAVLRRLIGGNGFFARIRELRRFEFATGEMMGTSAVVARTGYTGEPVGYEILIHPEAAPALWNAILTAGESSGVRPAGLGARDSTRTEAGLPLHGHELEGGHRVNPIEAGYGSFVKNAKPFYVGRRAMVRASLDRARAVARFRVTGRGPRMVRPGHIVVEGRKGRFAGIVTSCTLVGESEVGMAIVGSAHAQPGTPLGIFAYTPKDGKPAAKGFNELAEGDWLPVSKSAVVVRRFPDPRNPFPQESSEE
jgi:glycine hydroxymethyltransferase